MHQNLSGSGACSKTIYQMYVFKLFHGTVQGHIRFKIELILIGIINSIIKMDAKNKKEMSRLMLKLEICLHFENVNLFWYYALKDQS